MTTHAGGMDLAEGDWVAITAVSYSRNSWLKQDSRLSDDVKTGVAGAAWRYRWRAAQLWRAMRGAWSRSRVRRSRTLRAVPGWSRASFGSCGPPVVPNIVIANHFHLQERILGHETRRETKRNDAPARIGRAARIESVGATLLILVQQKTEVLPRAKAGCETITKRTFRKRYLRHQGTPTRPKTFAIPPMNTPRQAHAETRETIQARRHQRYPTLCARSRTEHRARSTPARAPRLPSRPPAHRATLRAGHSPRRDSKQTGRRSQSAHDASAADARRNVPPTQHVHRREKRCTHLPAQRSGRNRREPAQCPGRALQSAEKT